LFGYYLKVDSKNLKITADLYDSCCSHYLVTNGNLTLNVKKNEKIEKTFLKEGDAVWISSFVHHGFAGTGSLAKISDGQNFNYLEKIDLMNLYNPKKTLKRARKDKVNWGYDE
jgi:2-hydroxyethylphosphonate dioxygenase